MAARFSRRLTQQSCLLQRTATPLTQQQHLLPLTHLHHQPSRTFATHDVPVLPRHLREPDNIYRRPEMPAPSAPLSEDEETYWEDAQDREHCLDDFPNGPSPAKAVSHLLLAFAGMGGLYLLNWYWRYQPYQPVIDNIFPFNNLRLELGGLHGAKHSEGEREGFFSEVSAPPGEIRRLRQNNAAAESGDEEGGVDDEESDD